MPRTRREQLTFPICIRELEVLRIVDVGPGLRRITLGGHQLGAFRSDTGVAVPALRNEGFDDHVKLIVPGPGQHRPIPPRQVEGHLDWSPPDGRPTAKDYTPRRFDPLAGELDLEFVRHGAGAASGWAERATVGQPAWIAGPKSSALLPRDVDWLLVGGDETALPAIARLLDELPDDARAQVFIEVADPDHEVPLRVGPGVRVAWLHRDEAPPGGSDVLFRAISSTRWWDGSVYAWIAGETLTIRPIRSYLKNERRVPADCLEVTGYWRRPAVATGAQVQRPADRLPAQPADDEDPDDAVDARIDEMAQLTTAHALRAAVGCGLIQALDTAPMAPAELARVTGTHLPTLRALLRVLVAAEVLVDLGSASRGAGSGGAASGGAASGGAESGRVGLGPLGVAIAEDEHTLAELHPDGLSAALDEAVASLPRLLRTGPLAAPTPLRQALTLDSPQALRLRHDQDDDHRWPAPSIAIHHEWSGYRTITAMGPGGAHAAAAILRENPMLSATVLDLPSMLPDIAERVVEDAFADRMHLQPHLPPAPPMTTADALLAVRLLEWLPDPDAALVLGQLATGRHADLVVVETVLDAGEPDELAELDLRLRCAFGVGLRTIADIVELARASGLEVRRVVDIGWDMRMLVLRLPLDSVP